MQTSPDRPRQRLYRDSVFNTRRQRLLRTRIPISENISAVLVLFALSGLVIWVSTTREDFDPNERDLPIELLVDRSREIEIYNRPLKPWVEPGQQSADIGFELGPFPAPTLDSDWRPVGRVKHFQADNLYENINGEAEKFIKQGFVELSYLRLRSASDGSELGIELFDQGNLGGSLGVFAEHVAGRQVEERDGVSFVINQAGVIGRIDRYFFRVAGDRSSQAITEKAERLVAAFGQLNKGAVTNREAPAAPAGFNLLNKRLGIAEADIHFQEDNVFQYDFAQRFWFAKTDLGQHARLFVHIADTPMQAGELVSALVAEHSYEYDRVQSDGAVTLFHHRFLGTYFLLAHRGRYLYGVEKSPSIAAASALLERFGQHLSDDET